MNTVKKHTMEMIGYYLKKTSGFKNAVSSHSSLMPLQIAFKKMMGIALAECEKKNSMSVRLDALVAIFVYNLFYAYK